MSHPNPKPDARNQFFAEMREALDESAFAKLVIGKYVGKEPDLDRVLIKPVQLRGEACLSFVYRFKTKDITKNFPLKEAIATIRDLLAHDFKNAHLTTTKFELQLSIDKKDGAMLRRGKAQDPQPISTEHDRKKERYVDMAKPFLTALGITNAQQQLIPSMSAKWKQINKFVEVFSHAYAASPLSKAKRPIEVVDFGSGKGYLTFAVYDYLRSVLNLEAEVTGVELRKDMVELCNSAASRLKMDGLKFHEGDIRGFAAEKTDVMIALHACDVATDFAIHFGIQSGASIIMCSPCCHKQIRPQMQTPQVLQPMLRYGVHMGEEAEMVTDSIRALLLEAAGYETKVFEFISLEHTDKNKMILAVKHDRPVKREQLMNELREIKAFYGIREQALEALLEREGV